MYMVKLLNITCAPHEALVDDMLHIIWLHVLTPWNNNISVNVHKYTDKTNSTIGYQQQGNSPLNSLDEITSLKDGMVNMSLAAYLK